MSEEEIEIQEDEFSSATEVEVEVEDFLLFRNGEKIPIEDLRGTDYLSGIMIDTNGNPDFFPNYQVEKASDVKIQNDLRVVNDLIQNTPFKADKFSMRPSDVNKTFVNTVEAIVDIWQNEVAELQNIKYNTFKVEVGISPKTVRKFLGIGAKVKLVEWESYKVESGADKGQIKGRFLQKIPSKKKKRVAIQDEKHIEDFTAWFLTPEIQKWFLAPANTSQRVGFKAKLEPNPRFDKTQPESNTNLKMIYVGGKGVAGELWKIMKIMQITPQALAGYRRYDDDALDKVKERITKDVWLDPRTKKNDPASKGKWENTRWNIIDWSKSKEAPDPYYTITKAGKYKGQPRQIKSKKTAHNTWYNFAGILIKFLETHNISVPDQEPTSIFAQLANKPHYADIALTANQIEAMKEDIQRGQRGEIPSFPKITVEVTDFDTGDMELKVLEDEISVDKSFWDDCYFYFLLSLELGFRAEEAFTVIAREVTEESDNSGLVFFDEVGNQVDFEDYEIENAMQVQIYTRKSERPNVAGQGTRIHAGDIMSPECKELIVARLKEVLKGEKSKDPAKYGITKIVDGADYKQHSLIGKDGRYTREGTLNSPADYYQSDKDVLLEGRKGTVVGIDHNRDKMRGMFKHCYYTAKLRKEYWYERSLHSLRHVFAQYWLILSDYNYGFVAIIGHWKTESIVKEVYGKPKKGMDSMLKRKFATGINNDKTPFEMMQLQEKKIAGITEQEAKRAQNNYKDMELEKYKDQQKRDEIYNYGGMYGGVMYEIGATPKSIVKQRDRDSKITEPT